MAYILQLPKVRNRYSTSFGEPSARLFGGGAKVMIWIGTNAALGFVMLVGSGDWQWNSLLFLWLNLVMLASLTDFGGPFLFFFLQSYFFLLLVQGTFERILGYQPPSGLVTSLPETTVILVLGLLGVLAGYLVVRVLNNWLLSKGSAIERSTQRLMGGERWKHKICTVRAVCYSLIWVFGGGATLGYSFAVLSWGSSAYLYSYTTAFQGSLGGQVLGVTGYSANIAMIATLTFLATMPSRRESLKSMIVMSMVCGLRLMLGERAEIVLFILTVLCYMGIRHRLNRDEGWLSGRTMIRLGLLAIMLVPVLDAVGSMRGGGADTSAESFIYSQGVSVRVIDNVVSYRAQLPEQSYLVEFLYSGIIARILSLPIYQGNSLERAEHGGSLAHSLSRLVLGEDNYLSGLGSGSSFLAEGYVEWGYSGVLMAAGIIGSLLAYTDSIQPGQVVANSIRLLVGPTLIWAPRGSVTGFISTLVNPVNCLTMVLIFVVSTGLVAARSPRYPQEQVYAES